MGPADQVTSRMYSFGIRGKQFQYVEGKLPNGFPFHGRLTDHDVRNLQGRGAEILVLNQNFTSEDLDHARAECRGETGKTPTQAEEKERSLKPENVVASSAGSAATVGTSGLAILSTPPGADIEIDGSFVGNTPSEIHVSDGEHVITVKKTGYITWERKMKITAGSSVHLSADLDKAPN